MQTCYKNDNIIEVLLIGNVTEALLVIYINK